MKKMTVLFIGLLLILCQLGGCDTEHTPDETEASVIIKKVYDYENSKYKNILKILRQNILDI